MSPRTAFLRVVVLAAALWGTVGCGAREASVPSPLSSELRSRIVRALDEYETVRLALAADKTAGVDGEALSRALREAAEVAEAENHNLSAVLDAGALSANALGKAGGDPAGLRAIFSELSRSVVAVTAFDESFSGTRYLFECPMVDGFNQWLQPSPDIDNPYMGLAMPRCGSQISWGTAPKLPTAAAATAAAGATTGEGATAAAGATDTGEIAYYTCPMHPSIKQSEQGTCPICAMDLTPVTRHELETGILLVDSTRRQLIGLRTAPVVRKAVVRELRAAGRVTYDETRLADVTLKFGGWIGELYADETGMHVTKGRTLFTIYSPELYSAQQEFLTALASQRTAVKGGAPGRADYLVRAARERLSLWDLTDRQIDAVAEKGEPLRYVPVPSPVSGYVVIKNVVMGAAVQPGEQLLRIADLDRVWIEADFYENELPLVVKGREVNITVPGLPGKVLRGRVSFVAPVLDAATRTGRARIEFANEDLSLKPEMFSDVNLSIDRGERLIVPEEAVIVAGKKRVVFLDLGEGRLQPRRVEVGLKSEEGYEVVSGLVEGDVVVTSGNFLIAAESRLKSSMERW